MSGIEPRARARFASPPATGGVPESPFRILLAKPGLDGHDRGALVVARSLRDAGFEVIYTGLRRTPEEIAAAARDEDVEAVGVSVLSGAHLPLVARILACLEASGLGAVPVFVGGVIPDRDVPVLLEMGVAQVFGPDSPTREITRDLATRLARRRAAESGR